MNSYYLQKADEFLPMIKKKTILPEQSPNILNNGDTLTIDLRNHYVGYFSFKMWFVDLYIDAPVRMSVRFCETKDELDIDNSDYHGTLCESWLQEEIINLDFPGEYKMPRRYAARYIKIEVLHTPQKLSLSEFAFESVSSADTDTLTSADTNDTELKKIDEVSANTLKNCMQRVFEDGPKRDRRLWIGDLRLEALTDLYTFKNTDIIKRCLYLFAAADKNAQGFLPAYVYENPVFVSGTWYLRDYSLMYVCTLCDYYEHTKDEETFRDLYPVAKSIMDSVHATLDECGIANGKKDVFVDWCQGLMKNSSYQGIYLYTLDAWCNSLMAFGYSDADIYSNRLSDGRAASLAHLYDKEKNSFINEIDNFQYSVHSTAWMILGGVISGDAAKASLLDALNAETSVKPFTPYMHHYTVEALFKAGAVEEAEKYLRDIWGGMIARGADTFFEVYAPNDPDFSPYGDKRVNSMCHAWSCTPAYFIRKYSL